MNSQSTYTRSADGAEMIAIAPHVFVNAALMQRLKLIPHREEDVRCPS